jgi:hypothetical protein
LVDADRYVFALLGGHPRDADWDKDVAQKVADLMEEAADGIFNHVFSGVYYGTRRQEKKRRKAKAGKATPLDKKIPRRGTHRSKSVGASMGGGQEAPTDFFHSLLNTIVLVGLLAQKPFQRIAGFTNSELTGTVFFHLADFCLSPLSELRTRPSSILPYNDGTTPRLEPKAAAEFSTQRLSFHRRNFQFRPANGDIPSS